MVPLKQVPDNCPTIRLASLVYNETSVALQIHFGNSCSGLNRIINISDNLTPRYLTDLTEHNLIQPNDFIWSYVLNALRWTLSQVKKELLPMGSVTNLFERPRTLRAWQPNPTRAALALSVTRSDKKMFGDQLSWGRALILKH